MKKFIIILLALICITSSLSAITEDELAEAVGDDTFLKEILLSDMPITYGDEAFRKKILERTKGERDPIGLVLTGGSARACAHIGVLKYLDEIGVVPDFIVSNSMGSIIGMLYAAGVSPDQIEELLLAGDISAYFALTFPVGGGLLNSSGFRALVNSVVGKDYKIEDTEIPIMVVCDDLATKREIRITEGNFTDILIASFALPAYFDPCIYRGHALIDGGVLSLAPIDAAYEYTDTVILSTTFYDAEDINLLNTITILNSSFDIGKRQNAARDLKRYTDIIWIRCDVEAFSFMAFSKSSEMAQIGYENAKEHKDELLSLYITENNNPIEKKDISSRIDNTKKNLRYFGRINSPSPSNIAGLVVTPVEDAQATYFLKNSVVMGFKWKFLAGPFEAEANLGFGLDTQNLSSSSGFLTTEALLTFYPSQLSRIKLEGHMDLLRSGAGFKPLIYAREGFDFYLFAFEKSKLMFNQSFEYSKDYSKQLKEGMLLYTALSGTSTDIQYTLRYHLGYMLSMPIEEKKIDIRQYAEVGFGGELNVNSFIFQSMSAKLRISLDKKNSVPIFVSDAFTTSLLNYGATQLYSSSELFNLFLNMKLGTRLPSITFGEFLNIEKNSIAVFFSSLLNLEGIVGFSVGVELGSSISIIGLVKLPLQFRVGYEFREGKSRVVASLMLTRDF